VVPLLAALTTVLAASLPPPASPGRPQDAPAGEPGYWQQRVHYRIEASLDEESGVLSADGGIRYVNHSPDTLVEFYLHLHLNAFRPGSRWADRDSVEGRRRFNDLRDPDHAFERLERVAIGGVTVEPDYPFAPDSTVARFDLPAALAPGDSMDVALRWQARLSTVVRRQGRRGRHFDFAQWYPRVVVYDRYGWQAHPLYPAGEFYGEFGTYDVTLDLAEDQVIGATGVPVEGDPGWERARANPLAPVTYQRNWYGAIEPVPSSRVRGCGTASGGTGPAGGRKCVRFYAADVHHFAFSLDPEYVYEEGRFNDVVVRVLYLPFDAPTWGNGIAVGRTVEALRWLHLLFGPYLWPQITNVHRLESGGTEFPMLVMNGDAGLGLIIHEVGHNYLMGILANNEWKEGFLDEGFSNFQGTWYRELHDSDFGSYYRTESLILDWDLDRWSQPVSLVSEDYRDFETYRRMIYTKGELFFHQLRYIVGDENMLAILREYYRRWKLKHVSEDALRQVAEDVSGLDLKEFFAQWLHGTPRYDYAIGRVRRRRVTENEWETSVEVIRKGDGIIPVDIGEAGGRRQGEVIHGRASGRPEREVIRFRTAERPGRLMLDPRVRTHDWNFTNNRERRLFRGRGATAWYLDTYVRERAERDRRAAGVAPSVWYNDVGKLTLGLRFRSNYLHRFDRSVLWVTRGTSTANPTTFDEARVADVYVRLANPTRLARPGESQWLEAWAVEGRTGGRLGWERERRPAFESPTVRRTGVTATWMVTRNVAFLDPLLWDEGGTAEFAPYVEWDLPFASGRLRVSLRPGVGVAYAAREIGQILSRQYDVEPFFRGTGEIAWRGTLGRDWGAGLRFFVGGYQAETFPLAQRAIPVAGGDPYETFDNPFVRSVGALLVRPEVFYHSPGNGGLRGFRPGVGGRGALTMSAELDRRVLRDVLRWLRGVHVVAFTDYGLVDGAALPGVSGEGVVARFAGDAGLGLRFDWSVGDLDFPLRVEFPFYVSHPIFAHNTRQGLDRFEFRWLVSLEPSF
jgi:hypothetical protein